METVWKQQKQEKSNKTLYNYYASKKLYLTHTSSKVLLIEKMNNSSFVTLSLMKRNVVISNKNNGMRIFPKNR